MTHLRQMMLDELQRRNYSQSTVRSYVHVIEDFAKHFHRSPDRFGPDHIRPATAAFGNGLTLTKSRHVPPANYSRLIAVIAAGR